MPSNTAFPARKQNYRKYAQTCKSLLATGFFNKRQAEHLAYHLFELVVATASLRVLIDRFLHAFPGSRRDVRRLDQAHLHLNGELQHISYHARKAERGLDRLSPIIRQLPPLSRMTDYQISKLAITESREQMYRLTGHSVSSPDLKRRRSIKAQKPNRLRRVESRG